MSADGPPADESLAERLLADRLLVARRGLAALNATADVRIQLQRRLIAICDAIKTPGADSARCAKRLELFLAELDRAGADGA